MPGEDVDACTKPFLGHLEDLRATLIRALCWLVAGVVAAIFLATRFVAWLTYPLELAHLDPQTFLRVLNMTGGLTVGVKLAFWGGLILSTPMIVHALMGFIFPGLTLRERAVTRRSLGVAAVLFAVGVLLAYFVVAPLTIRFILQVNAWFDVPCEFVEFSDYVDFLVKLLLSFGLAFQFPVVVFALGAIGIVSAAKLRRVRAHVIVANLVVGMLLTPTTDPLTQILLAAPLQGLYELTILAVAAYERRRPVEGE